jgi:hypothetical protein
VVAGTVELSQRHTAAARVTIAGDHNNASGSDTMSGDDSNIRFFLSSSTSKQCYNESAFNGAAGSGAIFRKKRFLNVKWNIVSNVSVTKTQGRILIQKISTLKAC